MKTWIIRTSAGRNVAAYDSLERARCERDRRQANYPNPLVIVEQRLSERRVA